jgi:hypothetical protein
LGGDELANEPLGLAIEAGHDRSVRLQVDRQRRVAKPLHDHGGRRGGGPAHQFQKILES